MRVPEPSLPSPCRGPVGGVGASSPGTGVWGSRREMEKGVLFPGPAPLGTLALPMAASCLETWSPQMPCILMMLACACAVPSCRTPLLPLSWSPRGHSSAVSCPSTRVPN